MTTPIRTKRTAFVARNKVILTMLLSCVIAFTGACQKNVLTVPGVTSLYPAVTTNGFGFINQSGKLVIEGFTQVKPFSEGLAVASKGAKYGFIDATGQTIIPFIFDMANPFSDGLAAVRISENWGFIDMHGSFKIRPQFKQEPRSFVDGYSMNGVDLQDKSLVLKKDFFIDKNGNRITPPNAISLMPFSGGKAWLGDFDSQGREYWTVIDKKFHPVSGRMLMCIIPMPFSEGMASVHLGSCTDQAKVGYVNDDGKVAIAPRFNFGGDFKEGLAKVNIGTKWGFIDKSGTMRIPPQFDKAGDFSGGLAAAWENGKLGFIDQTGKWVIPAQFSDVYSTDTKFTGELAGLGIIVGKSPMRAAIEYVNRKGQIIYGPVEVRR